MNKCSIIQLREEHLFASIYVKRKQVYDYKREYEYYGKAGDIVRCSQV